MLVGFNDLFNVRVLIESTSHVGVVDREQVNACRIRNQQSLEFSVICGAGVVASALVVVAFVVVRSGCDEVSVVRVVAQSSHRDAKRLTLEMKPGLSIEGLGMVLGEHGIELANDPIDGIRLQFTFQGKGLSLITI